MSIVVFRRSAQVVGTTVFRLCLLAAGLDLRGANIEDAQALWLRGQYDTAAATARKALEDYGHKEEWQLLLVRSLLSRGKYSEAREFITNALARNSWSIQLRWTARDVFLANGDTAQAQGILDEVINTVSAQPRAYREAPDLVVFAQAALAKGADPKRVLDSVLETAKKAAPKLRDVYLAGGQLALDKHDYALAAKKYEEGLKQLPEDPDLHFGLARAYAPSDPELTQAALEAALSRNSNHIGCLVLMVDHNIDAEDFKKADELLEQISRINPAYPDAWAYRAVIAHFRNDSAGEERSRLEALKSWPANPRVDHLIGLKLSQHYRFAEGAAAQQRALRLDPGYLPAKAQLAQDLLRLGREMEGWLLAEQVHKEDGYDVEAYNLTTLRGTVDKFATLTNDHFTVRMSSHEAALYGTRVLDLLNRAWVGLTTKYGFEPKPPVLVEIFPEQKDFAVRTFGMPGNPGYLGVCFGSVITANSPASQSAHRVNWEAVLWHEFCHSITLGITRNKMPRWLSEGISVYEELQANPAWGQKMGPQYREMVLGDELTPVSKLSGAFFSPETDVHLQFAYYQSALVVEFLVQKFGMSKLKGVLNSLGEGIEINQALERNTVPMAELERAFTAFARQKALDLAPGLDWERPPDTAPLAAALKNSSSSRRTRVTDVIRGQSGDTSWETWSESRPTNFWVMTRKAQEAVEARDWTNASPVLTELIRLYPDLTGEDNPYRLLARVYRAAGETNREQAVLTVLAGKDDEALDAYARLMQLGETGADWALVLQNASRYLAVHPLVPEPYRYLATAAEATGDLNNAIFARRALLLLNPVDPAAAHFHLAQLLRQAGNPAEARLQVLQALEEAPRYRAALSLLQQLQQGQSNLQGQGPPTDRDGS